MATRQSRDGDGSGDTGYHAQGENIGTVRQAKQVTLCRCRMPKSKHVTRQADRRDLS
jgi:hypothetical protein